MFNSKVHHEPNSTGINVNYLICLPPMARMGKRRPSGSGGGGGGAKKAKSTGELTVPPDALSFLHMQLFSEWAFLGAQVPRFGN